MRKPPRHTYTYEAEEREASATSFDPAGNQTGHVNIIYDENGKNLTDWGYIQDNGVLFKIINKYDQSGRLTQIDYYFNGEEVSSYVTFEYDEKGNKIREVRRDADGSMEEISTFSYDDAGYLIRHDWYDWYSYNGALRYYYLYEWGSEGRLVQISRHNADGTLESRTVKRYDDQGNHIGEDIYPTDRLTVRKNEKPAVDCETADLQERTEQRKEDCCKMVYGVEVLPDDGRKEDQKTEKLVSSTSRLTVEVSSLDTAIAAAIAPTEKLLNTVLPAQHQTEPLETLPSEATDLLTHQDDNPNTKA